MPTIDRRIGNVYSIDARKSNKRRVVIIYCPEDNELAKVKEKISKILNQAY
jgi:hypothetical protein